MSLLGLHRTYGAARPDLGPVALAALTARGGLSYGAYWARLATLPRLRPGTVDRLVVGTGLDDVLAGMACGRGQVLVLLHLGHWELAGAWAARRLGGLTTVAEVLGPGPLARLTTRARAAAGIDVVPAGAGTAGVRRLVGVLRDGGAVALLADRDLRDRGVHARRVGVDLGGLRTTLAAGPAELALATGAQLRPVVVTTVRRRHAPRRGGARHRVELGREVEPGEGPRGEQVARMTRACARVLGEAVRRHTSDWHLTRLPGPEEER